MGLEIKIAAYRAGVKTPSAFDLINQLPELKDDNVWLKALDSQALQAAVRKVDVSYKNFFKGAGFPKFQNKHGRQSYQCPHDRDENAAVNIKEIGYEQYCKNNSGKPLPEEPVEMSALAGSVKQEIPLF